MGMYTQLFLDLTLKKDIPTEIIDVLNGMVNGDCDYWKDKQRLNWCFNSSSYYFNNNHYSHLIFDKIGEDYRLLVLCDFKNYDNEIETFIDWLLPFIEDDYIGDDFIGYHRYEEDREPTLLYLSELKKELRLDEL